MSNIRIKIREKENEAKLVIYGVCKVHQTARLSISHETLRCSAIPSLALLVNKVNCLPNP